MTERLEPSIAIHRLGTDQPASAPQQITCGPLSLLLDGGQLRDIRFRGTEVLRGISYLVRDKDWGTCPAIISGLTLQHGEATTTVSYAGRCQNGTEALSYTCEIVAAPDGTLTVTATGTPETDFLTCRTGFAVLHPLANTVGRPLTVTHTDGTVTQGTFPEFVNPGQPFFKIRALSHEALPGVMATVTLGGNVFEMEDQRNWMDASYKTYAGSLLDPWPYTLKRGQPFRQRITLSFAGPAEASAGSAATSAVTVSLGQTLGPLPRLALGVSMAEAGNALAQAAAITALRPDHLLIQINPLLASVAVTARIAAALKAATDIPLCAEIVLPAERPAQAEMAAIRAAFDAHGFAPDMIVVTQRHDLKSFQPGSPRPWGPSYEEMASAAAAQFPGTRIGGGMISTFTELNRKQPPPGLFDFFTHTVCPIVHAADDFAVMQCLETLPHIFASARAFMGDTPYHLGPSGIAARDNPYGSSTAPNPDGGRVCLADQDPRQAGLFGAAWTLGLIAAAARASLTSVALLDVTGPRGLLAGDRLAPAFHVFAGLTGSRGDVVGSTVSSPAVIASLAVRDREGTTGLAGEPHRQHSVSARHGHAAR